MRTLKTTAWRWTLAMGVGMAACRGGSATQPEGASGSSAATGSAPAANASPSGTSAGAATPAAPGATGAAGTAGAAGAPGAAGTPGAAAGGGGTQLAIILRAADFDTDAAALVQSGNLELATVDPAALLADGVGQPPKSTQAVAGAACVASTASTPTSCTVTLTGIKAQDVTNGGLAIRLKDSRAQPSGPAWATTYGFISADALGATTPSKVPTALILSATGLERVAGWVQLSGQELLRRGAVLGTLVTGDPPAPLVNAVIKPTQRDLVVGYATEAATAGAAATSALGMFVATPPDARAVMAGTWRIVLPNNGGTSTTAGPAFGATGGIVSTLWFSAP